MPIQGDASFFAEIDAEVLRAEKWGKKFASLHEACAVILEEYEEVWEICRQKRGNRDPQYLEKELIQLAAMTLKALRSMENFTGKPEEARS